VENRPLARALHKHGKIGKPVPVDMYRAVAEVIAHVMRIRAGAQS
jgi:flagellar biosynthetic protein FlhB